MPHPAAARDALRLGRPVAVAALGLGLTAACVLANHPATADAAANPNAASTTFRAMTEAQRVGQLFMVGTPATGLASQTVTDIQTYHVGNVILTGRSGLGVSATRSVTNGQGIATLQMLNILEGFDFSKIPFDSAQHVHLFVEANPIPVKWAMARMGLMGGALRLPMTPLLPANEPVVEGALRAAGLLA